MIRKFDSLRTKPSSPVDTQLPRGLIAALILLASLVIISPQISSVIDFFSPGESVFSPTMLLMIVILVMIFTMMPSWKRPVLVKAAAPAAALASISTAPLVELSPAELQSMISRSVSSDGSTEVASSSMPSALPVPTREDVLTAFHAPAKPAVVQPSRAVYTSEMVVVPPEWSGVLESYVLSEIVTPLLAELKQSDSVLTQALKLCGYRLLARPVSRTPGEAVVFLSDFHLPPSLAANAEILVHWQRRQNLEISLQGLDGTVGREGVLRVLEGWVVQGKISGASRIYEIEQELEILERVVFAAFDGFSRGTFTGKFIRSKTSAPISIVCLQKSHNEWQVATNTHPAIPVKGSVNKFENFFSNLAFFFHILRESSQWAAAGIPTTLMRIVEDRLTLGGRLTQGAWRTYGDQGTQPIRIQKKFPGF